MMGPVKDDEAPPPQEHLALQRELARYVENGWDASALLLLRRESVFSFSEGTNTSVVDLEELIRAAKDELRRARGSGNMPNQGKAELVAQMLDQGGLSYPQKFARLMQDAGVVPPSVTIEWRNLSVEADALVGSGSNPSLGNSFLNLLKRATCQGGLKRQKFQILKGLHGKLQPGSVTLLLGPPGSGKSVFLQTLSGRLHTGKQLRIGGDIKYNGVPGSDFVLRRTVALVEQHDYHIPTLTVLETCQFAHSCVENVQSSAYFLANVEKLAERLERDQSLAELDKTQEEGQAGLDADGADAQGQEAAVWKGNRDGSTSGLGEVYDQDFMSDVQMLIKQRARPHMVLKMIGLSDVADTIVGDAMTRGISGGQRKRVTTAEIMCGAQTVVLMDEISTGLDSATTYSVVQAFASVAHALKRTFVISLLQPAPEVVHLFDDVLLLTEGRVMYHGPVDGVLPFFERELQFACPLRKDIGSFLQEVTTPVGQYAYASPALLALKGLSQADQDPMKLVTSPPKVLLTPVEEIEAAFWTRCQYGQEMLQELESKPYDPKDGLPYALYRKPYASSALHLARLVLARQIKLNKRDKTFYLARALQAMIVSLIMASLWATITPSPSEGRQVMALCSLSTQMMVTMSMPQIGIVFATKRVYYKQRDNRFFPPASYVLSQAVVQIPQSFLEVTLFTLLLYWIAGLTRTAANYFIFWVVLFSISNCMAGFYRLLAYSVNSMILGNAAGALALLFLMILNGFSIVRTSIPKYVIWVYWMNPIAWALRALVSNELNSARWGIPLSGVEGTESVGQYSADQFGFFLGSGWEWGSVGVSWGALLLFMAAGTVALTYTNPASPKPTVAEEDDKKEVKRGIFQSLEQQETVAVRQLSATLSARGAASHDPAPAVPAAAPEVAAAPGDTAAGTAGSEGVEDGADEAVRAQLEARVSRVGEAAGEVHTEQAVTVAFVPITLVCRNLRYFVDDPSRGTAPGVVKGTEDKDIAGKLELLKGIDMFAEPGTLTALMGGSGAGKTTLMDCILGRKTVGLIRGDILVNGHPKDQATWSRVAGYVEQQDVHSSGTTVREALFFSARLRLPEHIPLAEVLRLVDQTLEMVDLTSLHSQIVGDPGGEGLSIEQRKRLSIAVELVANPSVVFMDEPTSGLDARAAAIVMRAVKNVSLSNRTVVVTIHQPSLAIFEEFDQLVLLQRGGRLTYFGALGVESSALVAYLCQFPGVETIRPGYNPATWMLEVTGGSMSTAFKSSDNDFPVLYASSQQCRDNQAKMERLVEEGKRAHEPLSLSGLYATSLWTQTRELTRKWFKLYWRNPNYNFVRFIMTLCIALILGLIYLDQGDLGPSGGTVNVSIVQNIMGLIFVLNVFLGMFNCMTVQPVVSTERVVFYRERSSRYYAPMPYALASGLVELPYLAVQAVLMVMITYWMVGFERVAWKFFYFLFLYFCSLTMFTFFGQFIVFLTPNQLLAQLLSGVINQLWSIFAGFMVPYPEMPVGWRWMNRISPTTWTLYGLVGSQLSDRSDVQMTGFGGETVAVSQFMKAAFGYEFSMIWWCVLIVAGFCVFFRVSSTLLLRFVNFQKR